MRDFSSGYDGELGTRLRTLQAKLAEDEAARIRKQEEEKARNHRAWLRLCSMMGPIGGLSDR